LASRAEIRPYGDGASAVFRWTPLAEDVGSRAIDFVVSDGEYEATETVRFTVQPAGEGSVPIFREPLGTGTRFDLAQAPCLELPILVEDNDSTEVTLAEEAGQGELVKTSAMSATWRYCPSVDTAPDRVALVLSADDHEHPKTYKNYLIVVAKPVAPEVPVCTDDGQEPDDDFRSARRVDLGLPTRQDQNSLCAGDEDWVRIYLFAGETVVVTARFAQSSRTQDLDLHLYQGTTDLTPCSEADPSTCTTNGQSDDANETLRYTVDSSGYYYVVVHGWDGAENGYDLCLGLGDLDCPELP
jgi:hypothetical protein